MRRFLALGLAVSALGALAALRAPRPPERAAPEVVRPSPPAQEPAPPPRPPAEPEKPPPPLRVVPVSGEEPARVAPAAGASRHVIVYLHGFCSDASGVQEWAAAAQRHATLIAPHGELECDGQPGRYRWNNDIRFIDYRIQRAIRSVSKALGKELDGQSVTLVGYSEGAARAESLVWLYPNRYRRAALMSGPEVPAFDKIRKLERLAVLRGEREYRRTYRLAAEHFDRAGIGARFWELPGASHGELGPEAPRVLGEVFGFLLE